MFEDIIDNDYLIPLVEDRPVLWDRTLDIYKDRNVTKQAWRQVCCALKENYDDMENNEKDLFGKAVVKRWTNLRDAFLKANKRLQEQKRSSGGSCKIKKYVYSVQMHFLNKLFDSKETVDSITDSEHPDEEQLLPGTEKEWTQYRGSHQESRKESRKFHQTDELEIKMIKSLEPEIPNSHMCFFQGILPHLKNFDDSEVLQFQMGVLQVISKINEKKKLT